MNTKINGDGHFHEFGFKPKYLLNNRAVIIPSKHPTNDPLNTSNGKCTPTYTCAYAIIAAQAKNTHTHCKIYRRNVPNMNMATPK